MVTKGDTRSLDYVSFVMPDWVEANVLLTSVAIRSTTYNIIC